MVYAFKLNPTKPDDKPTRSDWLQEFKDVFSKELIELPPYREVDHAIEPLPRSHFVAKRP